MSSRSSKFLLDDIREATQKIRKYTLGMSFDQFVADDKTIDAVVRNFDIVGEASNRLPEEFKAKANIDWVRIRGCEIVLCTTTSESIIRLSGI